MHHVQTGEERDPPERGREPEAEAAEELADLDVVLERLQRLLIPLEHRSREEQGGRDPGQDHAEDPVGLPRALERPGHEHAEQVQPDQHDHGHGAPVMESPDELPERDRRDDPPHAFMGYVRVRVVVLRQIDPGPHHQDERDQRESSEGVRELVGVLGDRILQAFHAEPFVQGVPESSRARAGPFGGGRVSGGDLIAHRILRTRPKPARIRTAPMPSSTGFSTPPTGVRSRAWR